jgi:hypothetical protein
MYERTTKVDEVLRKLGIAVIVLGGVGGLILLATTVGRLGIGAILATASFVFSAIISGVLLIGFAVIIRLLDEIRSLNAIALRRGPGQSTEIVPGSIGASGGITENSDGTYTVRGRKFKTLYAAEAHLKFLEGLRK